MEKSENKATTIGNSKATTPVGPVTVHKNVTIFRKEGSSAYFRRNAKHIPEGKYTIGAGINSVLRFRTNIDEMSHYMPHIVGVGVLDPAYAKKFADWCENIAVKVPETGLNLDTGFIYKSTADRDTIVALEKEIYDTFNKTKKDTSETRDLAFEVRDKAIVNLETIKYKHGFPTSIADYIVWRYSIVYRDVANDIALINKHGGIRFYIYDAEQEKYKEELQFNTRKAANILHVKLYDEPEKATNILWNYMGENTNVSTMSERDIHGAIETLAKASPNELVKLYHDKNLVTKATIERLIHYGILKRLAGTNIIVDENNDTIGNDMSSTIAFFKNDERNKEAITRFKGRLRSYTGK